MQTQAVLFLLFSIILKKKKGEQTNEIERDWPGLCRCQANTSIGEIAKFINFSSLASSEPKDLALPFCFVLAKAFLGRGRGAGRKGAMGWKQVQARSLSYESQFKLIAN